MIPAAIKKLPAEEFLIKSEHIPVIDVRSPSEFNSGHIPGAFNIPLFDDQQRAIVGTKYKKEGRLKALLAGIDLTGPFMGEKIKEAVKICRSGKLLVHCWRGGMRSETMAWLFSLAEIETEILDGGYKAYRHLVLSGLEEKRKVIVLGGLTGSSKTHILGRLQGTGNQVIDLEGIANHKGSAFGALGQPPQPSSEYFSNLLYEEWRRTEREDPVWLEDESKNIGTVFMPDPFYSHIRNSPAIILLMSIENRIPRLIEEYSSFQPEKLKESIMRISKRLGGDNTREAISAVESGDFAKAIEITLTYYDKTYLYGISKHHSGNIIFVETDTNDIDINAQKVLEAAGKIKF